LTTNGRSILLSGVRPGNTYAIFDMQGRVIVKGRVNAENFSLTLNRPGSYIIRVDKQTQSVMLK
jgi:hypothetical protein